MAGKERRKVLGLGRRCKNVTAAEIRCRFLCGRRGGWVLNLEVPRPRYPQGPRKRLADTFGAAARWSQGSEVSCAISLHLNLARVF